MNRNSILPEAQARQQMVEVGLRLHQKNLLAACDGNVSIRLSDDRILITPTGQSKGDLKEGQISVINLKGEVVEGQPSGERLMHLEVYQRCPEAMAVVHAHPPHAIAWSVAFPGMKELPAKSLSEVILAAGAIPIVDYARPGTAKMGGNMVGYLPEHRAMILARHGAICWGESLTEAANGMERIEHSAQILYLAKQLGPLTELPEEEVHALYELRKQIGPRLL